MSLLELGPVIFGGTDAIISFLRTNGLDKTASGIYRMGMKFHRVKISRFC